MKTNLKGSGKFARILLAHGEKLGMLAVLVCAGLLIASSLGRPKLGKTADELNQQRDQASRHYTEMLWSSLPEDQKITAAKYAVVRQEALVSPVAGAAFPPQPSWDPRVIEEVGPRKDPELFAPLDLEARGQAGLWVSADPEVIRQRMLAAQAEAQKAAIEEEEERRRLEEDAGEGRRGGFGESREGGYPGGFGEGRGFGGGFDGQMTRDGVIVQRPKFGAPTQGFEEIRNRTWVTVVAKVPIRKQFDAYEDALSTARGYSAQTDVPVYRGYQVQRAEVVDGKLGEWRNLANVTDKAILQEMAKWPPQSQTPEVANPKYVHPLLTFPLPPMVLRPWGEEATHSDLPIPTPEDLMQGMMPEDEEPKKTEGDEGDSNDPFASATKIQPAPGGYGEFGGRGYPGRGEAGGMPGGYPGMGGRGGEFAMGGRGFGMPGGEGRMGGRGFGGEYGGRGGMGMGGMGAEMQLPEYAWDGVTKTLLFRYFDATAQPGKKYRYRVRLVITDVNGGVPEKYLDKTVTERRKDGPKDKDGKPVNYRFTDWSEPSSMASVPQPGLVYLAGSEGANPANLASEPEARLLIKTLDAPLAAELATAQSFIRGSVVNLLQQKAQVIWSDLFDPADPEYEKSSPSFDFVTGLTLLDFRGGEQLDSKNRDLTGPTAALMMDGAGRIFLQDELDDRLPVLEFDQMMDARTQMERQRREQEDGGGGRPRR
jgi:hypothetical protein